MHVYKVSHITLNIAYFTLPTYLRYDYILSFSQYQTMAHNMCKCIFIDIELVIKNTNSLTGLTLQ